MVLFCGICANASIRDVFLVWRKGLRRIQDLPHNTHCNLLPLLSSNTLPLTDELSCRCAIFITNVPDSDNDVARVCCKAWCLFQPDAVADWSQCSLLLFEIRCSLKNNASINKFSARMLSLLILHAVYESCYNVKHGYTPLWVCSHSLTCVCYLPYVYRIVVCSVVSCTFCKIFQ